VVFGVVTDALLAAGDGEQFAVQRLVPVPVQAVLGEGGVESGAMAVALGVGQRAVDVEDQGVQCAFMCRRYRARASTPSQDF
jgi:hypothetical protein